MANNDCSGSSILPFRDKHALYGTSQPTLSLYRRGKILTELQLGQPSTSTFLAGSLLARRAVAMDGIAGQVAGNEVDDAHCSMRNPRCRIVWTLGPHRNPPVKRDRGKHIRLLYHLRRMLDISALLWCCAVAARLVIVGPDRFSVVVPWRRESRVLPRTVFCLLFPFICRLPWEQRLK
ncbi:hypothetical protein FRB95_002422 [Tulasnella sp. JGI-2019a]|nr:hypothetical protein FRB95_002422 [Tulasnella sp. JGI-2019a]